MKCSNKLCDSVLSECKGLKGCAKELEKANAQLEMINYFLIINHYLYHNENKCKAQKIEKEKEKALIEYQHAMLYEYLNA